MTDPQQAESPIPWGELTIEEHIAAVAREGQLFAAAARRGGLEAPIPTCPGWNMRDLVRHLSEIHLWAAALVAQRTAKLWPDDISEHTESWPELAVFWPADDDLIDWYLDTNANLVAALEAAPRDLEVPTFLPAPSPLAMWARRQANETTVHRFDAENASGPSTALDPAIAADGIYELLYGFAARPRELPLDSDRTIHVHADETGDDWYLTIGPGGISAGRTDSPVALTLSGAAADLYLVLWNRKPDSAIAVEGDQQLLATWHAKHRVRWS